MATSKDGGLAVLEDGSVELNRWTRRDGPYPAVVNHGKERVSILKRPFRNSHNPLCPGRVSLLQSRRFEGPHGVHADELCTGHGIETAPFWKAGTWGPDRLPRSFA